jgi:hypothetical protein
MLMNIWAPFLGAGIRVKADSRSVRFVDASPFSHTDGVFKFLEAESSSPQGEFSRLDIFDRLEKWHPSLSLPAHH